MAEPTLSLQPGHYPGQHGAQITITPPPGKSIISTMDGSDPLLVKTVASTNLNGIEYPYVQTIDSGDYRAVFDGAFTKFGNARWDDDVITQGERFFANALEFLKRRDQVGPKPHLLVLGDMGAGDRAADSYLVKNFEVGSSFGKFLTNATIRAGWDITIKDRHDYPDGELIPSMTELRQYDAIFFMSSYSYPTTNPPVAVTPEEGARNITNACREGIGLYICTDHGLPDIKYSGFFGNANRVLETLTNAEFYGSYDFSPGTTVAYNRALHGDSLLFSNMADDMIVGASGSDSYVKQDALPLNTDPVTVTLDSSLDYATIKVAVIDPDPSVPLQKYIYGYVFADHSPFFLADKDGNPITELEVIAENKRRGVFVYEPIDNMEPCSGYVKIGEHVVTVLKDIANGELTCTNDEHLYSNFRIDADSNIYTMPRLWNLPLTLEITSPIKMTLSYQFNRNLDINRNYDHIRAKWRKMIRQTHPMTENHPRSLQGVNNTYVRRFAPFGFFKNGNIHTDMRRYLTDPTASIDPFWIKRENLLPYTVYKPVLSTFGKYLFVLYNHQSTFVEPFESIVSLVRIDLETGERVEMLEGLPIATSEANLVAMSEGKVVIVNGLEPGYAGKLSDKLYVAEVVASTINDYKFFQINEITINSIPMYQAGAVRFKNTIYLFGGQSIPNRISSTSDICQRFTFTDAPRFETGFWESVNNLPNRTLGIAATVSGDEEVIFLAGGTIPDPEYSFILRETTDTHFYILGQGYFIAGPSVDEAAEKPFMFPYKYSAILSKIGTNTTPFQFLKADDHGEGGLPFWYRSDIMAPPNSRFESNNCAMTSAMGRILVLTNELNTADNPFLWEYAVR